MKTLAQRINNIIGQLKAVNRMLEVNEDCLKVLTQIKAAKSGLNAVTSQILEQNIDSCLNKSGNRRDQSYLKNLFKELSK